MSRCTAPWERCLLPGPRCGSRARPTCCTGAATSRCTAGLSAWETGRVGAGAPPDAHSRGWLEIYHGNRRPTVPVEVGAYCAGGMLLDLEQPSRITKLAAHPLLEPTEPYEQTGFVPNVVFPGGIVTSGNRILVYYGAADESTAVAETTWDDLWKAFDSLRGVRSFDDS